ncbi:MAG: tetratricopeptide repeat protein, partial [Myxococcota bacterium]
RPRGDRGDRRKKPEAEARKPEPAQDTEQPQSAAPAAGREDAINELVTRARARMEAGDHAEAVTILQKARKAAPRHAPAAKLLGDALMASGDISAACPHWKDFLKLAPRDPKAAAVKARLAACP